jgi:transposase InsO family protein
MLHVIALAQYAAVYTRSWAVDSMNGRVRLKAENDRLLEKLAQREEEIRIKDARMARIAPHRRPHYPPTERMAILELRAACCWSLEQTARAFQVTATTIASWMKRIDEQGPDALVQLREPVNKLPDFVRYCVQRLKILCPSMGKVKMAQTLCRAGLHLGPSTVGRILKESPRPKPKPSTSATGRVVTSKRPNHVWHIDLTTVSINRGFWTTWLPFALPQRWPWSWWLVVVVDHFSRRIAGIGVFANRPNCRDVCTFLGSVIRRVGAAPKYIVCDRDRIFDCDAFRRWVKRKGTEPPRYGAVGKHGSVAVVERLILTLKDECTRRILVPLRREEFRRQLGSFESWYNGFRPHMTLGGRTPNEVYLGERPAHRRPRIEPPENWPRKSPCARPGTLVAGQPGDRFTLRVDFHDRQRHLPIVTLRRAA